MSRTIRVTALAGIAAVAMLAQNPNEARDRGQTGVQDETQTMSRGRVGRQDTSTMKPVTITGTLVDGGCTDRSLQNLKQQPATDFPAEKSADKANAGAEAKQSSRQKTERNTGSANRAESERLEAKGVTVDQSTAQRERGDALKHQVSDLRTRQEDLACGITGATRGFAFLMPDGRLLNLDEGGNTLAAQAIQSSPKGKAMMNGSGSPVKPQAEVKGLVRGDRLIVTSLSLK